MRTLAALLFLSSSAFGQDCSVDGSVVNSATNAPIVRARVSSDKNTFALTDTAGKWSLEHVACGSLTLTASRVAFLANRQPAALQLVAGTPLHDVAIRLVPQAVVTGRVVNDHGDPLTNGLIETRTSRVVDGTRRYATAGMVAANDIGEYRAAGLYPGKYVLCAFMGKNRDGSSADANLYDEQCTSPMSVTAGANAVVDFQLTSASARHHVRGTISGAEDVSPQVVLDCPNGPFSAPVGGDGAFDIEDVGSGSCILVATAFLENDRLVGEQAVDVRGANVDGIHLHLEKGFNVSGSVRIVSAGGKQPDASRYSVSLQPTERLISSTQTVWNDERTAFTLTNVMPGGYRFRFSVPPPFFVESATLGGRDIARSDFVFGPSTPGIEITLSDNGGTLEGVVSSGDRDVPGFILLIQGGAEPRFGQADAAGKFRIEGLPPGDYKVSAWDDIANVEYANPAWMQLSARSVAVSIQAGLTAQAKLTRQVASNE